MARPSLPPLERFEAAIRAVWESGMLSNSGPFSEAFEAAFARYRAGSGYVLCANTADIALTLALRALGLPGGSRALVTSLAFPSAAHALEWNGLVPEFVDVDPRDWCLHPEQLDGRLDGVSVIVATHMYGVSCDVEGLERLAERHGVRLVFDAAQAAATWVGDRHVTDFGDASVVSFSGTKIVTAGEGAIAAFRAEDAARRFEQLRAYGIDEQGQSHRAGLNGKLSELHAALGLLTLEELATEVARRVRLVELYRRRLSGLDSIALQEHPARTTTTPTYFVVAIDTHRDLVREALAARGIESRPYFPPLHLMRRFAAGSPEPLPVTERLGRSLLALPLYSAMGPETVDEVCDVVAATLASPSVPTQG
jgi:dTDP-4-amino-4,6-dideoxygalactose transaminase